MKTRFLINDEVFSVGRIEECYEYYEKYYSNNGFVLDKENENVYKDYDRRILLNEGDNVTLDFSGDKKIDYKIYDIDADIMCYYLKEF